MERKLVINADDFGYSKSVNQAIVKAHTAGILTSASLMVTGDAFCEAVELARNHPSLGVGLHLVIGTGKSALRPDLIPHLVNGLGEFPNDPLTVGLRYQFNTAARKELLQEIRAQLQRFKSTGLEMTHVDGHLHNHVHPYVLHCLVLLSKEFGIRFIRLPNEELAIHWKTGGRPGLGVMVIWAIFRLLRVYGKRLLSSHKIGYCERVYGLLKTGEITEDYLCELLPEVKGNIVEIYAHPCISLNTSLPTKQEINGQLELDALTSKAVAKCLKESGFTAVSFSSL